MEGEACSCASPGGRDDSAWSNGGQVVRKRWVSVSNYQPHLALLILKYWDQDKSHLDQ